MSRYWRCRDRLLPIGERTLIMAIVNTTPDSFSGDGLASDIDAAVAAGKQAALLGADIIDIGGESTRPHYVPVSTDEEARRTIPVIRRLVRETTAAISIDTSKAVVATAALEAGAHIINDISGLATGDAIARLTAATTAGLVLMRFPGYPANTPRRRSAEEGDLLAATRRCLQHSEQVARTSGVPPECIVLDPGFGFGLIASDDLELLRRLQELRDLGYPLLVGVSRKRFVGAPDGLPVAERAWGTAAAHTLAIAHGADILRVHDVEAGKRVARFTDLVIRTSPLPDR